MASPMKRPRPRKQLAVPPAAKKHRSEGEAGDQPPPLEEMDNEKLPLLQYGLRLKYTPLFTAAGLPIIPLQVQMVDRADLPQTARTAAHGWGVDGRGPASARLILILADMRSPQSCPSCPVLCALMNINVQSSSLIAHTTQHIALRRRGPRRRPRPRRPRRWRGPPPPGPRGPVPPGPPRARWRASPRSPPAARRP